MNNKMVLIKNTNDIEKLRNLKNTERVTIFLLNDIYFKEEQYHLPINLENSNVIFYGLNHSINNLQINNKNKNNTGLFSSVKNLYVRNLKISNAKLISNEVNGLIAGEVKEDVFVDGLELDSVIISDAISGGIVGACNNIDVKNSIIFSTISGRGVLGGLAGIAEKYRIENIILNTSFKPNSVLPKEKSLIDQYVGYLGERENPRVMALTEQVNEQIEKTNYQRKLYM